MHGNDGDGDDVAFVFVHVLDCIVVIELELVANWQPILFYLVLSIFLEMGKIGLEIELVVELEVNWN